MSNIPEIKDNVNKFIIDNSGSYTTQISEEKIIEFLKYICTNYPRDIKIYLGFLLEAIQEGSKVTKLFLMLSNFINENYTDTAICFYLQKYTFENNNYYFKNTREIFATSSRANNMDESSSSSSSSNTGIIEKEYDPLCKEKPNAAYCQNPQTFAFPSCFLWDIQQTNFVQENNNFNLNMIIFEIMIKIYDYAHDNTKSLDRVKGVDDAYIKFLKNIKIKTTLEKLVVPINALPAVNIDGGSKNTNKFSGGGKNGNQIDNNELIDTFSIFIEQIIIHITSDLVDDVRKIIGEGDQEENIILLISFVIVINKLFTTDTNFDNDVYKTDFIISSNNDILTVVSPTNLNYDFTTDFNISFIKLYKLSLIEAIISIFDKYSNEINSKNLFIILLPDTEIFIELFSMLNDNILKNYNLENDKESNNISLSKIIINNDNPIQNDFGSGTTTPNTSSSNSISNFTTPDRSSITSISSIDSDSNKANFPFPEFNQDGGAISQKQIGEITKYFETSRNQNQNTRFLNDTRLRVYTIRILLAFDIIEKHTDNTYGYTNLWLKIMTNNDKNINATNYTTSGPYNIQDFKPTIDSPVHPTLDLLKTILHTLGHVINNNNFDYATIEGDIDRYLFSLYQIYSGTQGQLNFAALNEQIIKQKKNNCCSLAYIYNNAGYLGPTDRQKNKNKNYCIKNYAVILDPAPGDRNINFDTTNSKTEEFGKMYSFVKGNGPNGMPLDNVYFECYIDRQLNKSSDNKQFKQDNNSKLASTNSSTNSSVDLYNISRNVIINSNANANADKSINVQCGVALHYNYDGSLLETKPTNYPNISNTRRFNNILVDIPSSPTLSHTRLFAIDVIVQFYCDKPAQSKYKIPDLSDMLNAPNFCDKLQKSGLDKTIGDLCQILAALTKFSGITNLYTISAQVYQYLSKMNGNMVREILHNDLTATIITQFMLLFGGYNWILTSGQPSWNLSNYTNQGKNEGGYSTNANDRAICYGNISEVNAVITSAVTAVTGVNGNEICDEIVPQLSEILLRRNFEEYIRLQLETTKKEALLTNLLANSLSIQPIRLNYTEDQIKQLTIGNIFDLTFEQLQKLYNFLKENSFGTYRRREIWLDLSPIQNIKDDTRIPDYIKTYINDFILNNVLSEFILFIETIDVFADNKRKYCGNKEELRELVVDLLQSNLFFEKIHLTDDKMKENITKFLTENIEEIVKELCIDKLIPFITGQPIKRPREGDIDIGEGDIEEEYTIEDFLGHITPNDITYMSYEIPESSFFGTIFDTPRYNENVSRLIYAMREFMFPEQYVEGTHGRELDRWQTEGYNSSGHWVDNGEISTVISNNGYDNLISAVYSDGQTDNSSSSSAAAVPNPYNIYTLIRNGWNNPQGQAQPLQIVRVNEGHFLLVINQSYNNLLMGQAATNILGNNYPNADYEGIDRQLITLANQHNISLRIPFIRHDGDCGPQALLLALLIAKEYTRLLDNQNNNSSASSSSSSSSSSSNNNDNNSNNSSNSNNGNNGNNSNNGNEKPWYSRYLPFGGSRKNKSIKRKNKSIKRKNKSIKRKNKSIKRKIIKNKNKKTKNKK